MTISPAQPGLHPGLLELAGYGRLTRCWDNALATFFAAHDEAGAAVYIMLSKPSHSRDVMLAYERTPALDCVVRPLRLFNRGQQSCLVLEDDGTRPVGETLLMRSFGMGATLSLGLGLAEALDQLHGYGLTHNNINSYSVWFDEFTGKTKLADFAFCRPLDTRVSGAQRSYRLADDVRYTAPELTGRIDLESDHRSDLYSAGVLLYHVATGRLPFEESDLLETIHAHLSRTPRTPRDINLDLPMSFSSVIMRLLAKSPAERYQTARGLKLDLATIFSQWRETGRVVEMVLGKHDIDGALPSSRVLYGRSSQMKSLNQAFERAVAGRSEVVVLTGPAGIGKSKLAAQLQPIVEARGAFVATKFDQFRANEPYYFIASCFRSLIDEILTGRPEEQTCWRSRIVDAVGINGQAVIDLVPELQVVIGPQPAVEQLPPHEARQRLFRTLRNFVRVFTGADHPLCMFLDDVQWSDPASLAVLHTIITDPETGYILVIIALRDEDRTAPPAIATLQSATTAGAHIEYIALTTLTAGDVTELLAETFRMDLVSVANLGQIILQKTGGNPLAITQLLSSMHRDRLIRFDREGQTWQWHLPTIAAEAITADVLELMGRKLLSLPESVARILNFAACLGTSFTVKRLTRVSSLQELEVRSALKRALQEGLVVAQVDNTGEKFAFLHDRIQQAAYAMVPASLRKARRLDIGRSLLSNLTEMERQAVPFEIIDNINEGSDLLESDREREQIAILNLQCGRRARASAAFDAALQYFRRGFSLLRRDHWASQYELARDIYLELFECAYVTGNIDEAIALFESALARFRSREEKAQAYYLGILLSTGLEHSKRAIALGIQALSMFGERLSNSPRRRRVYLELARVAYRLRGRSASELQWLPPLSRADIAIVTRLLMSICPAAYFQNPKLMVLAGLRIVSYSLRYGNGASSSFGYVIYALINGALLGRYRTGNAFGRLAIAVAKESGSRVQLCKIMLIYAGFVCFWREPVSVAAAMAEQALALALEVGDVQYANYSILQIVFLNLERGANLESVLAYCAARYGAVERTHDKFSIANLRLRIQVILALRDQLRPGSTLDRDGYDERSEVQGFIAIGNITTGCYYNILKAQLCYLFGEFESAYSFSEEAERYVECILGQIVVADHYLFRGLAAAALLRKKPSNARPLWRALKISVAKMAMWSRNCEENFAARALLLQAELAALRAQRSKAYELYDLAISRSRQWQCPSIECLANELAGTRYLEQDRAKLARMYLRDAAAACRKWGALGKLVSLEKIYGAILEEPAGSAEPSSTFERNGQSLVDLDTITRASAELVSGSSYTDAIERLIYLAIETVGAERGAFVVLSDGRLIVEALCTVEQSQRRLLRASDLAAQKVFSEPIAWYVLRTEQPLILQDASVDPRFKGCAYVQLHKLRSVMCLPLIRDEVAGVLYIENQHLTGVFDGIRLQPLRLIAHQISTLLDNMRLVSRLSTSVDSLQQALKKLELLDGVRRYLGKFVPPSVQSLIEQNPENPALETRQEDVSVMFLDMVGYTALSEILDEEELNQIIETYFSSFADSIHAEGGEISEVAGDGLMIIFRGETGSDHSRRAVRAALSARRKTAELNARLANRWFPVMIHVGIHSGKVLLGAHKIEGATSTRWSFTVTGFAANLAARIGALAAGDTILVSAATAEMIGEVFELEDLGSQQLRGVSKPIILLKVLGERAAHSSEPPASRPIGSVPSNVELDDDRVTDRTARTA